MLSSPEILAMFETFIFDVSNVCDQAYGAQTHSSTHTLEKKVPPWLGSVAVCLGTPIKHCTVAFYGGSAAVRLIDEDPIQSVRIY